MNSLAYSQQVPERIRHLSQLLAISCLILMTLLPIAVAVYWLLTDAVTLAVRANLPPNTVQSPLLPWQRIAGGLLDEIPLILLLMGVREARKCFLLFASGQIFTTAAVLCLRRFAGWAIASALAGTMTGVAISVVVALNNPVGMRHLAIGIGSDQLFLLFFAGMVWLMANVISQGQMLAEENASFI